jgi:peroxiredoxin
MDESEIRAVIKDCTELLQKFAEKKTLRFDKFSDVWKETNFGLMQQ